VFLLSSMVKRAGYVLSGVKSGLRSKGRHHPIDRQYGITTSFGVSPRFLTLDDPVLDRANMGYAGSQPSVVRRCFALTSALPDATLIDLGCGRGRVCVIATEFPFRKIIGLELAAPLITTARRNAAHMRSKFPERTPIEIIKGDATQPPLNGHAVVLFLYHSFGVEMVRRLIAHIEDTISSSPQLKVMIIYYNPVHGQVFDDSSAFSRFSAEKLAVEPAERAASSPGRYDESVVIYQSRSGMRLEPQPGAMRTLAAVKLGVSAEVIMD
jgi:hypothetical protein